MSRPIPLNESAVEVFTKSFIGVNRVLVLGGTGWFGRTALAMLKHLDVKTHIVASNPRGFSVDGAPLLAKGWDLAEIERFEPDVVLDFAYLTVNKAGPLGLEQYSRVNRQLSEELFFAASLPSTRRVITVSSGASIRLPHGMQGQPAAEAYALGKQAIEAQLAQISVEKEISVGIARAWSVSGGHIQNPRDYALSGMILDGLEDGLISVHSNHLVYRRYSAVEELLALAMHASESPGLSHVDSGGPLVEIEELAELVSAAISGSKVLGDESIRDSNNVDSYFSDGDAWDEETERSGLRPLTLEGQIEHVVRALTG